MYPDRAFHVYLLTSQPIADSLHVPEYVYNYTMYFTKLYLHEFSSQLLQCTVYWPVIDNISKHSQLPHIWKYLSNEKLISKFFWIDKQLGSFL